MIFEAYLEYFITFFVFTGVQTATFERVYKSSKDMQPTPNAEFQLTLSMRSKIGCALACRAAGTCISFSFDKNSGSCSMSSGITDNISDRIYYYDGCPSNLKYKLWTHGGLTLCLKYVQAPLKHDDAVASCTADNAHLALIDSDKTRLLMLDMLTAEGADSSPSGYVYFDGYDVGEQDIFLNWKGEILWTSWTPGNPDHGTVNCITGKLFNGYRTIDRRCYEVHPYVCQIDLF